MEPPVSQAGSEGSQASSGASGGGGSGGGGYGVRFSVHDVSLGSWGGGGARELMRGQMPQPVQEEKKPLGKRL